MFLAVCWYGFALGLLGLVMRPHRGLGIALAALLVPEPLLFTGRNVVFGWPGLSLY
ncbi:MAG: hypothetical protein ACOY5Y_12750 [Pseudomonadota bacterium]